MKKHTAGMKHHSGTGRSRTFKEKQKQLNRRCLRKGWMPWHVPFPNAE